MKTHPAAIAIAVTVFLSLLIPPIPGAEPHTLTIHCINVTLGDATFIEFPDGTTWLIDQGLSGRSGERVHDYIDDLGYGSIDYVVATHFDRDHYGGIDEVLSDITYSTAAYEHEGPKIGGDDSLTAVWDSETTSPLRSSPAPGQTWSFGGATVECVCVGHVNGDESTGYNTLVDSSQVFLGAQENSYSLGFRISWNGFDYLTCGDLTSDVENALAPKISSNSFDVLHVNHHGSDSSSSLAWCETLQPEVAVISVGESNFYGHPDQDVLDNLNGVGSSWGGVDWIYATEQGSGGGGSASNFSYLNDDIVITYSSSTNRYTIEGGATSDIYDADEGAHLLVTEVAVDANDPLGHDWIEVYMVSGDTDLSHVYMTDLDSVRRIADNGSLTMSAGDILIIHNAGGTSENDATGKGENDLWDVYQDSLILLNSDDQFIICTEESSAPAPSEIIDAVCWSNDDGSMLENEVDDGNDLIGNNQWGDPASGQGFFSPVSQGPAVGDIDGAYARRRYLEDDNNAGDWRVSASHSHGTPPSPPPTPTPSPTPIMSEDFDGGIPAGWTVTQDGDGNVWEEQSGRAYIGYSGTGTTEDSMLCSPSMDLSAYGVVTLEFWEEWKGGYADYWSDGYLYVSTDGGSTWDLVSHLHHDDGGGEHTDIATREIDLSPYAAGHGNVSIAWRYNGSYDWWWKVDDVNIFDGSGGGATPTPTETPTPGPTPASVTVSGYIYYYGGQYGTVNHDLTVLFDGVGGTLDDDWKEAVTGEGLDWWMPYSKLLVNGEYDILSSWDTNDDDYPWTYCDPEGEHDGNSIIVSGEDLTDVNIELFDVCTPTPAPEATATVPPTEVPRPRSTPTPAPEPGNQADVICNDTIYDPGADLTAEFKLNRAIDQAFTVYAVVIMPDGGILNALTLDSPLKPVATNVARLDSPFGYSLITTTVSAGAPKGHYEIAVVFFDPNGPITGRGDAFMDIGETFILQ